MKERITIEKDNKLVVVEVHENMYYIGEHMFMFQDMNELIETAKKYLK